MFGFYRVASCVPVVRVADVAFNRERILALARSAAERRASVILFPELALSAYSCGDLFHQGLLLDAVEKAAAELARDTAELDALILVGAPVRYRDRLLNAALVLDHGRIAGIVPKTHLPNYREFYEKRYFSSGADLCGAVMDFAGVSDVPVGTDLIFDAGPELKLGIEICEDMWSVIPPSSLLALNGATLLANLSASNELVGKSEYRQELVRNQSARCVAVYAYVSSGVHESTTDTVCGGHALVAENGSLLLDSPRFRRGDAVDFTDVDLARIRGARLSDSPFGECAALNARRAYRIIRVTPPAVPEEKEIVRELSRTPFVPADPVHRDERCREIFDIQSAGLAKRLEHTRSRSLVIGISGGLDSTLALLVCVNTMRLLGRPTREIVTVTMPGFGTTDRTYRNAVALCRELGTELREISIKDACLEHFQSIGHDPEKHDVTYENTQARERTQILMDIANQTGGLVVGTGDLSEIAMGWSTYNGDHMSMYAVNASVPKTLIRYLIAYVGDHADAAVRALLQDVIDTPVSPELLPAAADGTIRQKTEEIIGPYELHDFFLYHFLKYGAEPEKLRFLAKLAFGDDFDAAVVDKSLATFVRRFFSQQFKRSCMPDGPKVGSISLSPRGDWRMPSDAAMSLWS